MLLVGVDGDRLGAVDADVVQPVDGVVAGAAAADDDDARVAEVVAELLLLALALALLVLKRFLDEILHRLHLRPGPVLALVAPVPVFVQHVSHGRPDGFAPVRELARLDHLLDLFDLLLRNA